MARGASKKGRSLEIYSFPIEEYFPVEYKVVGSREWFETSFEEGAVEDDQKIEIVASFDLIPILNWMERQPVLGVDTEATGPDKDTALDPQRFGSRLLMLQIGTADLVYIIEPALAKYFQKILESRKIVHILHHGLFDFKYMLVKTGIHLENIFDTMLAEQLLTSGLNGLKVGLADVVRRYSPYRLITKQTRQDFIDFRERGELFTKAMLYYAARDVTIMFPVRDAQMQQLARWKMEAVAQDEFNIICVTAMMELGGVFIDPVVLRKSLTYWNRRQEELEQRILKIYDSQLTKMGNKPLSILPNIQHVFDLNSQAKKLAALRELGYEIDDVKRDTLELYADDPIMAMLAEYSNVTKITSTYGENMISKINPETGRYHPEFHQLGSGDMEERMGKAKKGTIATGRFSSDFQQMPRKEDRFDLVTDPTELHKVLRHFNLTLSNAGIFPAVGKAA